jgi:N-acetylmuramoyl-L-alanine amidase
MNVPQVIILHHSASAKSTKVGDVDRWHRARGFIRSRIGWFVGYHYFIEQDGYVTQTREHDEEGMHTIGQNRRSIGICLAGNFNEYEPTLEQVKATRELLRQLRAKYGNLPTYPHRHYARTDCFGTMLKDDYFAVTEVKLSFVELLQAWKSYLMSLSR